MIPESKLYYLYNVYVYLYVYEYEYIYISYIRYISILSYRRSPMEVVYHRGIH